MRRILLASLLALLPLGACEDDEPTTIKITAPTAGATVDPAADMDKTLDVTFAAGYFRLKQPGACPIDKQCGHIWLNIDGDACNDVGADGTPLPYNNISPLPPPEEGKPAPPASPIKAKFARCATYVGEHVIRLTLKDNEGKDVPTAGNPATFAEVKVMVKAKPAPAPAIKISAPAPGASVTPNADADKSVPVMFTVTGATLKDVGGCGMDKSCGHIDLLVDGHACDEAGKVWNASGAASPLSAKLGLCKMTSGLHTIELVLKDDTYADVPAGGRTAASVVINAP